MALIDVVSKISSLKDIWHTVIHVSITWEGPLSVPEVFASRF